MKKSAISLLLFACAMTLSAALWQTHALTGTPANCLMFSVPVVIHDANQTQFKTENQSLRFSVVSAPDSGVGVFNDNGSNLGVGAIANFPTQGISSSTRNSTTTAISCTDNLWDVNFVIRRNCNTIGDKVTFFVIKPDGSRLDVASFVTESGGVRFTNLTSAVFGINNRGLGAGSLIGSGALIPFSAANGSQTPLITASIMNLLPKGACSRFGIEIARGGNEGTTSVTIADVVADRDMNGPTALGPTVNADGSVNTGDIRPYPIGLTCPISCPSECPMPTPSCPPPTPNPTPTPTPNPTPTPTPTPPNQFCFEGINTGVSASATITRLTDNSLCLTITNTSTGSTTGKITSIGFDLPTSVRGFSLQDATNRNYRLEQDVPGNASGINRNFDFALLTGPNFNGGGNPNNGILAGSSASFCISGDFRGLTGQQIASGIFLRFQDVNAGGGSDVAQSRPCPPGGNPTPTPTPNPTPSPTPVCVTDGSGGGGSTQVGSLSVTTLPNGDISVRLDQSRAINDNSYGANAIGWSRSHTFRDLVGSDKAQFIFRDANGNTVLDFFLDYISLQSGTPSGYESLGPFGGDGRFNFGNAANVLSWNSSLARNLNDTGYCSNGICTVGGVNLLVDSPPADANYNITNPSLAQWNFTDSYEVIISRAAFGSAGFGSVSLGEVHNSPAKSGDNAITPTPCPGGGGNPTPTPNPTPKPPKGKDDKDGKH
ncbi:MAG: hypothetical protein MSG64_07950 [Pyrinomonadaceae bacterium MAG19_C2-C3]|nr:hypothetical protein [Pyrinomonadaceae bacterium MAG19_C2-C3]